MIYEWRAQDGATWDVRSRPWLVAFRDSISAEGDPISAEGDPISAEARWTDPYVDPATGDRLVSFVAPLRDEGTGTFLGVVLAGSIVQPPSGGSAVEAAGATSGGAETGERMVAATCSFYDRALHLWAV